MGEREDLEKALGELEALRGSLGDLLVDQAERPLRARLSDLGPAGTARGAVGGGEERRLVTALFADFAGYTNLVSTSDPEAVRELVGAAFAVLAPAIERLGGTIEKFVGDGVMALFGAPAAHEDDARRACLAALALREELGRFNAARGSALELHFGIGTGVVVAGRLGVPGQGAYSATGSAVNRAARLSALAGPGEILADGETAALAGEGLSFSDQADAALKGFDEPVPVRRLEGRSSGRRAAAPALPFVGREAELERLRAAWAAQAERWGPGAVFVLGEPGIGKTRLIHEWRQELAASAGPDSRGTSAAGVRVDGIAERCAEGVEAPVFFEARCSSYETASAYRLWAGLLDGLAGLAPEDGRKLRAARLRAALERLGLEEALVQNLFRLEELAAAEEEESSAPDEGEASLAAVAALLRALAAGRRLVFVAEDLQWCDPLSAELLAGLLSRPEAPPVFWLLLARDLDSPVLNRLGAAAAGVTLLRLKLEGLSVPAVEGLAAACRSVAGVPCLPAADLDAAGGNPFFLEELLLRRGAESARGPVAADGGDARLPAAFLGLAAARMDALPSRARETARAAAVLGDRFPAGLLEAMLPEPDPETLLHRDIIAEGPEEGMLSFRHGLLREAFYASLVERSRRELHGAAARAIKDRYPEYAKLRPEVMARHWLRAGEPLRALPHFKSAGEDLFWRRAYPAAAACLEAGLSAARTAVSPIHEAEFLTLLGRCRSAMGELDPALEAFAEALAIQRRLSNRSREMTLLRFEAQALVRAGRVPEAEAALGRALELAEGAEAPKDRARCLAELARLLTGAGDFLRAEPLAERAVAAAEAVKSLGLYRSSLLVLGDALRGLGRLAEAAAAYRRCAEVCALSGEGELGRLAAARAEELEGA